MCPGKNAGICSAISLWNGQLCLELSFLFGASADDRRSSISNLLGSSHVTTWRPEDDVWGRKNFVMPGKQTEHHHFAESKENPSAQHPQSHVFPRHLTYHQRGPAMQWQSDSSSKTPTSEKSLCIMVSSPRCWAWRLGWCLHAMARDSHITRLDHSNQIRSIYCRQSRLGACMQRICRCFCHLRCAHMKG